MNETHEKFPALLGMTLNLNLKNVEMDIWSFEGEMFGGLRVVTLTPGISDPINTSLFMTSLGIHVCAISTPGAIIL